MLQQYKLTYLTVLAISIILICFPFLSNSACAESVQPSGGGFWNVEYLAFVPGYGGPSNGPAREVVSGASALTEAPNGDLYFISGQKVFVISNGQIKHIAGNGLRGFRDGPANNAMFNPGNSGYDYRDIAIDSNYNIYIPDGHNNKIRKIFKDMNGKWQVSTFAEGIGSVVAIAVDNLDNVYTYSGSTIIKFSPTGTRTDLLSIGINQCSTGGCNNVVRMDADSIGNVYLLSRTGSGNGVYWKLDSNNQLSLLNNGDRANQWDGAAASAGFWGPSKIGVSSNGDSVYGGGGDDFSLRRINNGQVRTLFNDGTWGVASDKNDANNWRVGAVLEVSADGEIIMGETQKQLRNLRKLIYIGP